jgi:hypothetical protein
METGQGTKVTAFLCYLMAAGLIAYGFYVTYTYGDGSTYSKDGMVGHVVGGDAYNYIIIGIRGVGFMVAGLAASVAGAAASVVGVLSRPAATEDVLPQVETADEVAETMKDHTPAAG